MTGPPGPLYLSFADKGLVAFDGTDGQVVLSSPEPFHDIVLHGGALYLSPGELLRWSKGKAERLNPQRRALESGSLAHYGDIMSTPSGEVFVLSGATRELTKGKWVTGPLDTLEKVQGSSSVAVATAPADWPQGFADVSLTVDVQGRVWCVRPPSLWLYEKGEWKNVEKEGFGREHRLVPFKKGVLITSDIGALVHGDEEMRYRVEEFARVEGVVAGRHAPIALVRTEPDGPDTVGFDVRSMVAGKSVFDVNKDWAAPLPFDAESELVAMAVDGRGRTWVAMTKGLAVVSSDGKLLKSWKVGEGPLSAPPLAMAVEGNGPDLP